MAVDGGREHERPAGANRENDQAMLINRGADLKPADISTREIDLDKKNF